MDCDSEPTLVEPLTEREQDVLQLLGQENTNREIAEALVLSIHTVKWYNRQIYGKLGVDDRQSAIAKGRKLGLLQEQAKEALPAQQLPPPAMPLVGRQKELEELQRLLLHSDVGLVSIVAPGGMGKTRLALEVAHNLAGSFGGGAAFASLASLQSVEGLVPTLAHALGLKLAGVGGEARDARQQLLDYLCDRQLLLVVDNFEHLLEGAPLLAEIVTAAPHVKLLVTTRERLNLQAEHLFPVQGLAYSDRESPAEAQLDPAVQLFLQVGRRQRPAFQLRAKHLDALQRIFQLSDGMPLAIILAAGWLELLSPAQIAAQLEQGLDFLEAGYGDLPRRQRSMRAVFESTWERLGEQEQTLFAALSVFRGGFTLDAAREISGARPVDLRRLLRRSLLMRGEGGRFEVHELLRQFAAEQLSRSPEIEAAVRDAHSAYYLALLSKYESHLKGTHSEEVVEALTAEVENVYTGWDWAVDRQKFVQLSAGAFSLEHFSARSGRLEEGVVAFERAIEQLREQVSRSTIAGPAVLVTLARFLATQCALHGRLGSNARAAELGGKALSLHERPELLDTDTRHEKALALSQLAWAFVAQDRLVEAQKLLQQSIELFEEVGDSWQVARVFFYLGGVGLKQGWFDQAERHHRRAMQIYGRLGDRRGKARAQMALGYGLSPMGRGDEAEALLRECITVFRELGDAVSAATAATLLSETMSYDGRFAEALALAGDSTQEFERSGIRLWYAISQNRWCLAALHLGDYTGVINRLLIGPQVAHGDRGTMSRSVDDFIAGCAWLAQAQTTRACERLEESVNGLRETGARDYLCSALPAFCCALALAGSIVAAREALLEAAAIALELNTGIFLAPALAAGALLASVAGTTDRALELYAAALHEPLVANSRWWLDMVGRHIDAAALPLEDTRAARERGRALDLWSTVAQLRDEL